MAKKRNLPIENRQEAEELAKKPYKAVAIRHEDNDGKPYFVALNPELEGCMAHGNTSEEAIENLKEARADYIQVLLLNGDPIPVPSSPLEEIQRPTGNMQIEKEYYPKNEEEKMNDENLLGKYSLWLIGADA